MDRLDAMSVFISTVDSGSLSAAARKLSMPLTTVSRKLTDLEAHLGVSLLARSTRKLSLTEAGAAYLARCRQVLELVNEAEDGLIQTQKLPRGSLTVTAPLAFGRVVLLPILMKFLNEYPDVDLRLLLGDRNLDLIEERIDLALRIGALPDTNLRSIQVGRTREVVCATPEYFAKHGTPQTPEDLQDHPCITFSAIEHARHWTFGRGRKRQAVAIRSRLAVNTAEAAIDATLAGLGVTRVLCYQVRQALARGDLITALTAYEPDPLPVSLLFSGTVPIPSKLRAVIDFEQD